MRHIVILPILDDKGPTWNGGDPKEQGYKVLPLPRLVRSNYKADEYYIYTGEHQYGKLSANSAMDALAASKLEGVKKIFLANCRIKDVYNPGELEYAEKDASYMEKYGYFAEVEDVPVVGGSADMSGVAASAVQTDVPEGAN